MVESFEIEVPYVSTHDNLADFLTKVVLGLAMRSASDAASGDTRPLAIPPALKFIT